MTQSPADSEGSRAGAVPCLLQPLFLLLEDSIACSSAMEERIATLRCGGGSGCGESGNESRFGL